MKFEKVLGSKIDGRGGQLFFITYRSWKKLFPSYNLFSFYVRADDGLRDCWRECGLNSTEYKKILEEIILSATLPIFDVSFDYLKKRVREGIDYKNHHKLFLPDEFDECVPILEYEAVDDLSWRNPSFFAKTVKDYESKLQENDFLHIVDLVTAELFSEMLKLGWGFNDEDMDNKMPVISKIKFNPLRVFTQNKVFPDSPHPKTKKQADQFNSILKKLMEKIVDGAKVHEWEKRTKEAAYFCFNIGEKDIAERLHIISLSLKMVPLEMEVTQHPFLQALMVISIAAALKRNGFMCECGCWNVW